MVPFLPACFLPHWTQTLFLWGHTLAADKNLICKVGRLNSLLQRLKWSSVPLTSFSDAQQTCYHWPMLPVPHLEIFRGAFFYWVNPQSLHGEFQKGTIPLNHTPNPVLGYLGGVSTTEPWRQVPWLAQPCHWPFLPWLLDMLVFVFQMWGYSVFLCLSQDSTLAV